MLQVRTRGFGLLSDFNGHSDRPKPDCEGPRLLQFMLPETGIAQAMLEAKK
jgi:hypothetical protein